MTRCMVDELPLYPWKENFLIDMDNIDRWNIVNNTLSL